VAAGRWSLVAGTLTVPGPTGVNSAGPHRLDEWLFIDADSTIARAYGPAKQGVSFGYTKVRGYHPLIATVLEPGSTPEMLHTRLREGRANTARGAASFIAEAISRARAAGSTGELIVRLDGGFYNAKVIATCQRTDVRFSVTCRNDSKIRAAVAAIKDTAWTAIPYWSSHVDPDTGEIVESTRMSPRSATPPSPAARTRSPPG